MLKSRKVIKKVTASHLILLPALNANEQNILFLGQFIVKSVRRYILWFFSNFLFLKRNPPCNKYESFFDLYFLIEI